MTSSRELVLTADARRDLRAILRYSLRAWGEHQRGFYAARLGSAMQELTQFPSLGIARDDLAPGLRARPVEQYMIFYRFDEESVIVIRILHRRLDGSIHVES